MESRVHTPPRLLIGVSLLFWGAVTGNSVLGLIAALLTEGANWIRLRWKFGDSACSRAWRICMILMLIYGTLVWLDGDSADRRNLLPKLMVWLPLFLLPLQFVQSYGTRDRMALNSFSFFSKLHRQRNRKLGLSDSVINFNFGNLYFIAVIAAAGLGTRGQEKIFFPGLVLLVGWLIFSRVSIRPLAFCILVLMAGAMGIGGQIGLRKAEQWVDGLTGKGGYPATDTTVNRTAIGSLGKLKQSPDMLWRIRPISGSRPPKLIRRATYNRYSGVSWKNTFPEELRDKETLFRELTTIAVGDGEPYYLIHEGMNRGEVLEKLPSFNIRGAARAGIPLPLPGNVATLQKFDLDYGEINSLGTVRIFPKKSIIAGDVRWDDGAKQEAPPWPDIDLEIPKVEQEIVDQVIAELGLKDLPNSEAKIARIRQWFGTEFEYSRYLSIGPPLNTRPTPVGVFLSTDRKGHCEYFATAAALLLRAVGVPSRYCVGYAVMERDFKRGEYVVRGTHAHAWCRVWDGTRWIDFDATPPAWLAADSSDESGSRSLADTYQRLKEDFFLWRNRPKNRVGATFVMWLIGLSVMAFVTKRLWKSKLDIGKKQLSYYSATPPPRTPLFQLEQSARRILGNRHPGETYPRWLERLQEPHIPAEIFSEAIALHQRLRFDTNSTCPADMDRLTGIVDDLEKRIRAIPLPKSGRKSWIG